jgi:hypothetical protein
MTELIDFFNRHELFGWIILILVFVVGEIKQAAKRIGHQLNYTNRYLLLLVQRQYSNKEILEETSDLRPEPTFWDKLFK